MRARADRGSALHARAGERARVAARRPVALPGRVGREIGAERARGRLTQMESRLTGGEKLRTARGWRACGGDERAGSGISGAAVKRTAPTRFERSSIVLPGSPYRLLNSVERVAQPRCAMPS